MSIKSHTITYSLGRNQTANGFLIAQNDAVVGFAFGDPMSRFTFYSFDNRLKDLEKMVFRGIEDIEGSIMTLMDARTKDKPEPAAKLDDL